MTFNYIVSLEAGRRMKVLEKHPQSFGLTPEAYRVRWGLPMECPMAAPN